MRQLIKIIFLTTTTITSFGQSPTDDLKVKVYRTANGQFYNQRYVDSVRYRANHYVGIKNIKETHDSISYGLTHFDKDLTADKYKREGFYCGNSRRISLKEIGKQFPYSETHSIRVVSFKGYDSIPKTAGKIDFKKMYEVKTLDKGLTNKMMDILVNYDNKNLAMEIAFCWSPRNGIILMDKNWKVLSYLDICFECQLYDFEPKPATFGRFCNEKMDAIQGIMKKAGITYGLDKHVD